MLYFSYVEPEGCEAYRQNMHHLEPLQMLLDTTSPYALAHSSAPGLPAAYPLGGYFIK